MASSWRNSWGTSWGTSWGNSWGNISRERGGDGFSSSSDSAKRSARKKARYVRNRHTVIRQPEPEVAQAGEVERKVTRAAVREAVNMVPEWFWSVNDAIKAVPYIIAIPARDLDVEAAKEAERAALSTAIQAYLREQARLIAEAEDEDDIELLLLAA